MSVRYSCLYIADIDRPSQEDQYVHRVELREKTTRCRISALPTSLSVTPDGWNVVFTCNAERKVVEYTTHGELIREFRLDDEFVNFTHPIRLRESRDGQFGIYHSDYSDTLNRVCVVGSDGCAFSFYGGTPGSDAEQQRVPIRLVEYTNGSILVLNMFNRRVLLLNESLVCLKTLAARNDNHSNNRPWYPLRMCLDVVRGNLLGECERHCTDDRILLFQLASM